MSREADGFEQRGGAPDWRGALARHGVTEPAGITKVLRRLRERREVVHVFPERTDRVLLTAVVDVQPKAGRMLLDCGPDDAVNRQLLAAGAGTAVASDAGVRVLFRLTAVERLELDDGAVFAADLPSALARVQRRRFFRLPLAGRSAVACRIEALGEPAPRYAVLDLGIGGLALLEPDAGNLAAWVAGSVHDAVLELGDGNGNAGTMPLRLEVLHARRIGGRRGRRASVGCRFVALGRRETARLERYIRDEERRRLVLAHRAPGDS
jgi:c-di-GMP-binding flagellar brake protein YcgR